MIVCCGRCSVGWLLEISRLIIKKTPSKRGGFLFGGRIVVKIGRVVAEQIRVSASDRVEVLITDWRFLIRETRKIDPALIAKFKKNAKEIGRPVEAAVQRGIPNRFPITGMEQKVIPGRMTWGAVIPAKTTELKVDTRLRKKGKSIVSVWVQSPAVAMSDMAKKVGKRDGRLTREYPYSKSPTGFRRHRVNGQGSGMVVALEKAKMKKSSPSRMVWPSAEKALPQVNTKMYSLIDQVAKNLNAEIQRNA